MKTQLFIGISIVTSMLQGRTDGLKCWRDIGEQNECRAQRAVCKTKRDKNHTTGGCIDWAVPNERGVKIKGGQIESAWIYCNEDFCNREPFHFYEKNTGAFTPTRPNSTCVVGSVHAEIENKEASCQLINSTLPPLVEQKVFRERIYDFLLHITDQYVLLECHGDCCNQKMIGWNELMNTTCPTGTPVTSPSTTPVPTTTTTPTSLVTSTTPETTVPSASSSLPTSTSSSLPSSTSSSVSSSLPSPTHITSRPKTKTTARTSDSRPPVTDTTLRTQETGPHTTGSTPTTAPTTPSTDATTNSSSPKPPAGKTDVVKIKWWAYFLLSLFFLILLVLGVLIVLMFLRRRKQRKSETEQDSLTRRIIRARYTFPDEIPVTSASLAIAPGKKESTTDVSIPNDSEKTPHPKMQESTTEVVIRKPTKAMKKRKKAQKPTKPGKRKS